MKSFASFPKISLLTFCLSLFCANSVFSAIVKIDPALTAAVIIETDSLKSRYKQRINTQEGVIVAETAVTGALAAITDIETKTVDYMKNASDAVQNIKDIKKIFDVVSSLPKDLNNLKKAIPDNPVGALVTAAVSKNTTEIYAEALSLHDFISQLVSSKDTEYQTVDDSGKTVTKKKKVNLLNSAERFQILNEVYTRISNIKCKIQNMTLQLHFMGVKDVISTISPEGWAIIMDGKQNVQNTIALWDRCCGK